MLSTRPCCDTSHSHRLLLPSQPIQHARECFPLGFAFSHHLLPRQPVQHALGFALTTAMTKIVYFPRFVIPATNAAICSIFDVSLFP